MGRQRSFASSRVPRAVTIKLDPTFRMLISQRAERLFDGCARDKDERRGSIGAAAIGFDATWAGAPVSDHGIR